MREIGRVAPVYKWQANEDDPKTNNKIILTHVAFKGTFLTLRIIN